MVVVVEGAALRGFQAFRVKSFRLNVSARRASVVGRKGPLEIGNNFQTIRFLI